MKTISKYVLFINDDNEGEFDTRKAALDYIKMYIKGTAETYNKTQKYIREHTDFAIEKYTYTVY